MVDLGWAAEPVSVNAHGLVGGVLTADEASWQASLWEPATGVREMGTPDDWPRFTLIALNDTGQFAGTAERGDVDDIEPTEAYVWDPTSGWTGFGRDSGVLALNNDGQVLIHVGGRGAGVYEHHVHLWTPGAAAQDLGVGHYGMLNDRGQVVWGTMTDPGSLEEQVYQWDPATGARTEVVVGRAHDLNELGQVVGESGTDWEFHAYVWDAQDGLTDLGTLPGAEWSTARAINDLGQVVGSSGSGPPGEPDWVHAFLWDPRTGMVDLETRPGPANSEAQEINDAGQVIGWSGADPDTAPVVLWLPAGS